jgi:hypothetical protein
MITRFTQIANFTDILEVSYGPKAEFTLHCSRVHCFSKE